MYLKGTVKHYYKKEIRLVISHNERIVAKITYTKQYSISSLRPTAK